MTIQTLTNFSNFSKTRKLLQDGNLIEKILLFEPREEIAELFRQMCVSNLHIDGSFENNIYGSDTHRLKLSSHQAMNFILRVLWTRLNNEASGFRLDEPLLTIFALLWDEYNRSLLSQTNLVLALVKSLIYAKEVGDVHSFSLALNSLKIISQTSICTTTTSGFSVRFRNQLNAYRYSIEKIIDNVRALSWWTDVESKCVEVTQTVSQCDMLVHDTKNM